jgi:hypothetical protein
MYSVTISGRPQAERTFKRYEQAIDYLRRSIRPGQMGAVYGERTDARGWWSLMQEISA